MNLHFDCVYYRVADLDRAIAFYREVLGLHFLSRDAVARFDVDGVQVELVVRPLSPHAHSGGNARLCFRVEDIRAARAELQKVGVPVGPVEEMSNGLLVRFADPDSNELALWQGGTRA